MNRRAAVCAALWSQVREWLTWSTYINLERRTYPVRLSGHPMRLL